MTPEEEYNRLNEVLKASRNIITDLKSIPPAREIALAITKQEEVSHRINDRLNIIAPLVLPSS